MDAELARGRVVGHWAVVVSISRYRKYGIVSFTARSRSLQASVEFDFEFRIRRREVAATTASVCRRYAMRIVHDAHTAHETIYSASELYSD